MTLQLADAVTTMPFSAATGATEAAKAGGSAGNAAARPRARTLN
jgi:hypothetical protein